MKTAQELVNVLDGEGATRWWRRVILFLLVGSFFSFYGLREYKNLSNPEAMDMAQLARNISLGRGYVTDYLRISSLAIVKEETGGDAKIGNHPDIVNPPLYPVLLAGVFKGASLMGVPIQYVPQDRDVRYLPEIVICVFNQILLLAAVLLTFSLGKRLFDREVGIFAAAMLFLNELIWRFSVSGLPTILSMVILLCLFHALFSFRMANLTEDKNDTESIPGMGRTLGMGALIGLLTGLAALNQYALGWLVIPVVWFVMQVARSGRKISAGVTVLLVFVMVLGPWIARNIMVSGLPFGLATYAPAVGTAKLGGDILERVSTPDILVYYGPEFYEYTRKLIQNLAEVVRSGIPGMGESWLTICFLAGILLPFVKRGLNSTRFLLVICILLTAVVQAATRTGLSDSGSSVHSENLLMVFLPIVFVFGSAFIFTLIEEINYGLRSIRTMIIWFTGAVLSLPLWLALLPPTTYPLVWPPYYPQTVSRISSFYRGDELFATDMPWAVAWYGQHVVINLPLDPDREFFKINDGFSPIKGLYLTQLTLDRRFLSELSQFGSSEPSWGGIVTRFYTRGELPETFPLKNALADLLPDQLLLSEWDRWRLVE
ncbi:MAG TPA: hypothetical protein PLV91_00430 [Verrucomicrobiota bacterium]|nr:hypothetical protein [Verrucomicrobiota bacterium]